MRSNHALSPEQKLDARKALAKLAGICSLETAANAYLLGKRPLKRVFVSEAADDFLQAKISDGCRSATVEWYDEHLKHIIDAFGHRLLDEITRGEFKAWLDKLAHGLTSKAGTARAARALWNWAIKHDPAL